MIPQYKHALIVGAGSGLSASLGRLLRENGLTVSFAARNVDKLSELCSAIDARAYTCDVASTESVDALFAALDSAPDVVVFNPGARAPGEFVDVDRDQARDSLMINAYGGFLVAHAAANAMVPNRHGAILLTGASASVKGYPKSALFAMGKFALRGLAQSLARELHPKGVHVGHFVIDGGIRNPQRAGRVDPADNPDSLLDPDDIARTYWNFLQQDRSSWAWEIELRPWVENF
ncbi:MAG: SDR family NAD(P)-dependent oxidoreductase [Pseudomonadota bacterium]